MKYPTPPPPTKFVFPWSTNIHQLVTNPAPLNVMPPVIFGHFDSVTYVKPSTANYSPINKPENISQPHFLIYVHSNSHIVVLLAKTSLAKSHESTMASCFVAKPWSLCPPAFVVDI